jgi:Chaperone of endosialidase
MSYNGSGTFLINSAGQPVVANTVISATVFNALTSDLATGLSTAITKDGQTTITNNIPFSSNKITGLGSGTAAADAANLGQVQSTVAKLITVTGTDTITGSMSPQLTAYAAGQLFYFVANAANTGAVTINIDSLGAKSITRDGSSALAAGDINSGEVVVVIYDGTRFQMINAANSFGNTTINGTLTVTGNAGFQANVSITSALSVGGVFAVTGAATFTANPTLSAGTANGVLYLNGSKVATSGSALTFDGSTLTNTGSSTGSIFNTIVNTNAAGSSGTDQRIIFAMGGSLGSGITGWANAGIVEAASTGGLYLGAYNGPINFATGSSARNINMTLTAAGNVGIGTASPAAKLDVYQSSLRYVRTYPSSGLADFEILTNNNSQPAFAVKGTGTADLIRAYSGATQALTLDSSGNLGLGVTPSAWSTGKAAEIGGVGSSVWGLSSGTTYFTAGYYFNTADKFAITGNYALFSQLVPADGSFRWVSSTATGTAGNNATMTERMRLDASGNLGLGMTPSAWDTTGKAIENPGGALYSYSTSQQLLIQNAFFDGAWKYKTTAPASYYQQSSGAHAWHRAASGTAGNAITFTTAMTLDASGNLGIGTTSPTSLGSGYQSITTNGTNGSGFVIKINGTDASYIYQNSTALQLVNTQATPIYFFTSNTERGRFTAGGYFKASNDGTYANSTANYHEFRSTNNSYAVYITNTNASPLGTVIEYTSASPNGTGNVFLYCGDNTALRAQIRSNGGLANYQANDVNLSDQRVKKDIKPLGSMWDKFKALEIVTFKYKDQTHDDDNIGVIAQQVESVAPEFIDTDGFGNTPEGEEPLKTVYTTDMYHAAIKALQEAMARIEQLEAKVAALEA